jgi:hypothetical protein
MINGLIDLIKQSNVKYNSPIAQDEFELFEKANNVRVPSDLKAFFSALNGFGEDEMLGLSNFRELKKMLRLTEMMRLDRPMTSNLKEAIENGYLYNSPESKQKIINASCGWELNDAASYFIFGDYNVESCFWAINLSPENSDINEVLCLYVWGNSFRWVANSFSEFVHQFISEGGRH